MACRSWPAIAVPITAPENMQGMQKEHWEYLLHPEQLEEQQPPAEADFLTAGQWSALIALQSLPGFEVHNSVRLDICLKPILS